MYSHLILFDGDCPVCNLAVRHIVAIDLACHFVFASLKSRKAREILGDRYDAFIQADTLILIEHYLSDPIQLRIRSRALLRIYWIVGRLWSVVGLLSFLPSGIGDLFYRLFAISRYQFRTKLPSSPLAKDRLIE